MKTFDIGPPFGAGGKSTASPYAQSADCSADSVPGPHVACPELSWRLLAIWHLRSLVHTRRE